MRLALISHVLLKDLYAEKRPEDLLGEPVQEVFEELEGFQFVHDEGVFLLIDGGLDGMAQVVHLAQVFYPQGVDLAEGNHFSISVNTTCPSVSKISVTGRTIGSRRCPSAVKSTCNHSACENCMRRALVPS